MLRVRQALPVVRQLSRSGNPVRGFGWGVVDPSREVRNIVRDMERVMGDFERDFFRKSPFRFVTPRLVPIEGLDTGNRKVRYAVDLRGFKPEDIKISLKEGKLKIEAKVERGGEDGGKHLQHFVSEFTVPENLDVSALESTLHNDGTLVIAGALKLDEGKKIPIGQDENNKQEQLKS